MLRRHPRQDPDGRWRFASLDDAERPGGELSDYRVQCRHRDHGADRAGPDGRLDERPAFDRQHRKSILLGLCRRQCHPDHSAMSRYLVHPYQAVAGGTFAFAFECVSVAPQGTFAGPGWYANYSTTNPPPAAPAPPTPSSPSPQAACAQVPVLATATLDVFKTIVNNTGETIAVQPAPFSGSVSCQQFPLLPVLTPGDGSWSQTDPSVSGPTTLS